MLPIALCLFAAPTDGGGLAAVRKQFGEANLPNGSTAEVFNGPGLRLGLPAGYWHDPHWGEANINFVPWTARHLSGDFEVEVRVRLVAPRVAEAAGVTMTFVEPGGTRFEIIPAVMGGLYLSAGGQGRVYVSASYERRGELRTYGMKYGLSAANTGSGGGATWAAGHGDPLWLTLRRVGDKVQFRGGADQNGRPAWCDWFKHDLALPGAVDLRLFATGNLDKPFTVEFDRFTVTPLAAEKK